MEKTLISMILICSQRNLVDFIDFFGAYLLCKIAQCKITNNFVLNAWFSKQICRTMMKTPSLQTLKSWKHSIAITLCYRKCPSWMSFFLNGSFCHCIYWCCKHYNALLALYSFAVRNVNPAVVLCQVLRIEIIVNCMRIQCCKSNNHLPLKDLNMKDFSEVFV